MKFLFITGSRGEWGYIKPILSKINQSELHEYVLVVTNMHLVDSFGRTSKEILEDGFQIHHLINAALDGYTHYTQAKSNALVMLSLPDIFEKEKPDWVVLAGDRGEQLAAAFAAAYCRLPIAHIQAGEKSGNIDGMARHAIGKLANIHFASNEDAKNRLVNLGEEKFRIYNVGAPQIDELLLIKTEGSLFERFNLHNRNYCIVVFHPVTELDNVSLKMNAKVLIETLNSLPISKVLILPNNDAGSRMVVNTINTYTDGNYIVLKNISRLDYLSLLKSSKFIIGNSSSGILEAPFFRIPTINLGTRQDGRLRAESVIDIDFDPQSIIDAINSIGTVRFKNKLKSFNNFIYGDGQSSLRILEVLEKVKREEKLLNKRLTY